MKKYALIIGAVFGVAIATSAKAYAPDEKVAQLKLEVGKTYCHSAHGPVTITGFSFHPGPGGPGVLGLDSGGNSVNIGDGEFSVCAASASSSRQNVALKIGVNDTVCHSGFKGPLTIKGFSYSPGGGPVTKAEDASGATQYIYEGKFVACTAQADIADKVALLSPVALGLPLNPIVNEEAAQGSHAVNSTR